MQKLGYEFRRVGWDFSPEIERVAESRLDEYFYPSLSIYGFSDV